MSLSDNPFKFIIFVGLLLFILWVVGKIANFIPKSWNTIHSMLGWFVIIIIILGIIIVVPTIKRFFKGEQTIFNSKEEIIKKNKNRPPIPPKLRELVYKRANYTCQVCKTKRGSQIDHIDGNPSNNTPNNLILLCGTCHDDKTLLTNKKRLKKLAKVV